MLDVIDEFYIKNYWTLRINMVFKIVNAITIIFQLQEKSIDVKVIPNSIKKTDFIQKGFVLAQLLMIERVRLICKSYISLLIF